MSPPGGSKKDRTQNEAPPSSVAQTTPRDMYPTSDIRFVMLEIGKLSANVDRLIADVKSHGDKIDTIRHQATYVKATIATGAVLITAAVGLAAWLLNAKWDAILAAMQALAKLPK